MSAEEILSQDGSIKKLKRRRAIGAALVIVGVLCVLLSFISSSSTSYTYYPNEQGGVIPYPTSSTSHPFLFMIVPGIAFLIVGVALVMSSRKKLRGINTHKKAVEPEASPTIPSTISEEPSKGKFCRFCGACLETSDSFCSDCGKRLA